MVRCPHCNARKMLRPKIRQDVVAVMPCPECQELAVMFRDIVIPLERKIIENGTNEERAQHFAKVIAAFLDAGIMPFQTGDGFAISESDDDSDGEDFSDEEDNGITKGEMEEFVRVELKSLDNAAYFKKHFG